MEDARPAGRAIIFGDVARFARAIHDGDVREREPQRTADAAGGRREAAHPLGPPIGPPKGKASALVATYWREPTRALRRKLSRLVAAVWREPLRALRRSVRHRWDERRIRASGLFDARWYARTNPDVASSGLEPLVHFVRRGAAERRDPNPWFDTSWYLERNPRANRHDRNPLVHYLGHPDRDPHPDFDARAYVTAHPDVGRSATNPLAHFLGTRVGEADEELAEARATLATGVMNVAWYGAERTERVWVRTAVSPISEVVAARIDRADTLILQHYVDPEGSRSTQGGAPSFLARALAPLEHLEDRIGAAVPLGPARGADGSTSFTVVTPFFRHIQHLGACARSILDFATRITPTPVEWILVNDDPDFPPAQLEQALPPALRGITRILADGRRAGIVARLNEGIRAARHEWILFVDCDDLIEADAGAVLRRYIERFPRCRYVSSAMIDVDEDGGVIRYRRRTEGPVRLLAEGMTAGHLKAIRRDAFGRHGMFDPAFEGCQDYEFALRMALEEPLLYVPEYLYSYRWHRHSQSVANATRQSRTADAVVRRYGLELLADADAPRHPPPCDPVSGQGAAIVRTQGTRNELLVEALHSIRVQALPLTAVVVVHGGPDALAGVRAATADLPGVEILHAPDTARRRGHPLNVALAHVVESGRYGFACFLDDDDVLYPLFSSRMHEALSTTGADLVYAATNRRVLWDPAEEGYAPLPPPCLLVRNFIPINSYAVRVAALRRARLSFDERLEYNEDWDFLVAALGSRLRFHAVEDVLSEFRITGEGNLPQAQKKHAKTWDQCLARIRPRQVRTAQELGRRRLLEQMLEFPAHLLERRQPDELELVLATRAFIDETCPAPAPPRLREVGS